MPNSTTDLNTRQLSEIVSYQIDQLLSGGIDSRIAAWQFLKLCEGEQPDQLRNDDVIGRHFDGSMNRLISNFLVMPDGSVHPTVKDIALTGLSGHGIITLKWTRPHAMPSRRDVPADRTAKGVSKPDPA